MKMTNYRLQTEIEHLSPLQQTEWFKNYLTQVLESEKPYYVKSDYIALSFMEIDNKLCIGCALCAQICPENAILPVKSAGLTC